MFSKNQIFSCLKLDPVEMDRRIHSKVSIFEFAGLSFSILLAITFFVLCTDIGFGVDFHTYYRAARGDPMDFYYAAWLLPFLEPFSRLPFPTGFLLFNLINIAGVFFASRVFNTKASWIFFTYQIRYNLSAGTYCGILVGGLALFWWGLAHKRWWAAGIGLVFAAGKPHTGLFFSLLLFLMADVPWKERFRTLVIPAIVSLGSLLIWPAWPLLELGHIQAHPPNTLGNISLAAIIGPWALLVLLPPLLLPLKPEQRFLSLAASIPLILPYFQQSDLLALFILPYGPLVLLGNLGFLKALGWTYNRTALLFVSNLIYVLTLFPSVFEFVRGGFRGLQGIPIHSPIRKKQEGT